TEDLLDNKRQISSIKVNLDFHIVVDFALDTKICFSEFNDDVIEIICSYHYFLCPNVELGSFLLSENMRDCDFYAQIGSMYTKYRGGSGYNVSFQKYSGNGSETFNTFERLITDSKFVLCLVDNDKSHPYKGEGTTSSHFNNRVRCLGDGCEVYVLPVREIESMIPISIITEVLVGKNDNISSKRVSKEARNLGYDVNSITTLDKIVELNNMDSNFRKYFDHKEGLNLRKALDIDENYGLFWKPFFRNDRLFVTKDCRNRTTCTSFESDDNCNCIFLKGLGNNILEHSLPYIKTSSLPNLLQDMPDEMKDHWLTIGQKMMSWGCALAEKKDRAA
ncbi:hypothetical protein CTM97_21515, partial [Photobacterium phosphoreum]